MSAKRTARISAVQIGGAIFVLGVPLAIACGGKIDNQNSGGGSSTSSGSPSSTPAPQPSSSTSVTTAVCDANGLSTLPGTSCAVSFQHTIFPQYLGATGTWRCADVSCHGTVHGTSATSPSIDGIDARAAYVTLAQYRMGGAPYIDACSSDPKASAILGNLTGSVLPQMPSAGGGVNSPGATPEELANLRTWLACGAPFN